jgi:glycerol-1-phosphate dehydrogenase [NAD(P)+]
MLTLFYGLLLSGISMKIAGSSSPASGGEHLISHYWDMRAPISGREPGLHGAQVGVATLVTATLYSVLRDEWRTLSKGVSCAEPEHMEIETRAGFNEFYGALAPEVAAEYLKKFPSVDACRADADAIRRSASEIEAKVWPSLKPASKIRETLLAAGAPVTIDALGLGYEDAEEALLHGREIRGRYTVLDLAWELGVLPTRSAEMLEMVSGMLALKM